MSASASTMPPLDQKVKPNPRQKANLCSRLFFWWLNPLFKIGHKRKLEEDDMYPVLPEDRSQHLGKELQGYWDQEVSRAQKDAQEPSLMKAIIKCYGKSYLVWGILTFLEEGTRVVQPIFLGKMVSYVENYDPSDSAALHEAYGYAAGLSACALVWAVLHHLYFYHMQRVGMRLRVAVCHMIYRKSLCLSSSAMGKTTTGQIVNLLSNDVNRFDQHEVRLLLSFKVECDLVFAVEKPQPIREVTMFLHYLWVGPLQAIAVTALLWMEIGMSCLAGMAVLTILLLLQSCFGKLFSSLRYRHPKGKVDLNYVFVKPHSPSSICERTVAGDEGPDGDEIDLKQVPEGWRWVIVRVFRSKTAALTDDRISTMSEVISGIKTIKMNAWENSFIDVISRLRSKIMIFVTFITNDLLDNLITASQVFVVVTLFEALRFSSTLYFPMAVEKVSEAIVSIQRIENFLLLDEIPQLNTQLASDGKRIVDMSNFTASWDKKSGTPTLQDLILLARPGELLAVVGPVGSGKSSLLRAVLGELPPSQGQVSVHGRIAYVPQQPWVFSGTVRSNILFGKKYEKDRYEEVIKACALGETENIEVTLPLEDRLEGKVGIKTYNDYFTAGAQWFILIFLILVNIAAQVAYVLQDWWFAYWANLQSDLYFGEYGKGETDVMLDLKWYLGTYSGLTVSTILFGITRSLLIFYILVNSSQTLHNKMLRSILRAPVLFFYRNPIGRILNRFSKDIGHMDDLLPLIFQDFIQTFLLVVGVVGVMVAAIPWTAIPVIPLGIIFFVLRWYFLRTSREVKRLECTTRSLVFSHLASSLRGLWTIRAYKAEQRFQELFNAYQDLHSDVICAIFATVVAFGALILVETLDLGLVGLVLSLTFTLTGIFQWCVRQSAEVENMMISVERGIEYTDLEKEAPWELEYRPPPIWPPNGRIYFFSVNLRYNSDSPLVLRNLEPFIYSRKKVGIVGRSGAGKSSLIAALFRLSEPEGDIYIDGILTTSIGLHDLRKKMSVALQVQFKESIEGLPAKMNTELAESGLNLSAGQKQLVCLARALLRKNQILIMDKATSYVDPRNDEFIQNKIRERFAQCTVLTIANRLSTVIDCEWIMVYFKRRQPDVTNSDLVVMNVSSGQPSAFTIFVSTL
ncbi:hypothetical protein MJG53_009996 [Ovis ammon polii x Ovis aries]|uniref:Uncharacterized protein n=1 Tax=Ovis ammon polii x Ovis aries TaxID=2918886 RepID=A0ACB9UVG5_9CETA|nr:hypothetical protein MJG53_009996 [Ovis ammon polii x Ovis aries]